MISQDALARKSTIVELVTAFQCAEARTRSAFAEIVAAEADLNAVFLTTGASDAIHIGASRCHHRCDFTDIDGTLASMSRDAWRFIVERLELRRMMSVKRWEELDHKLDKEPLPPITLGAVSDFVDFYLEHLGDMLAEAVSEIFEMLRPHDWTGAGKLKTNQHAGEVPCRVIMSSMVEPHFQSRDRIHVRYGQYTNAQQQLVALENVFSALDGKGSICKTYKSALEAALNEAPAGIWVETPYFRGRGHLNGRLHLEFRRPDLLKRFNAIAGGKHLKAPVREAC